MFFADVESMIQWSITTILVFVSGTIIPYLYARLKAQEAVSKDLDSRRLSWKELEKEGRETTQAMANAALEKAGMPPVVQVTRVVPESHSPSTEKQRDEADLATAKAGIVAIRLAVGQEPRPEPEHAVEPGKALAPVTAADVKAAVRDALAENVEIVKKDVKEVKGDVKRLL